MDLLIYNTTLLILIATLSYSIAFSYALYHFLSNKEKNSKNSQLTFYLLLINGFLIQGLALYYRGIALGSLPLTNTLELLQVISWSTVFLVLIFQIAFELRLLAFFSSGLVSIIGIISLLFYKVEKTLPIINILQNPWIEFHALLAIFAYGAFGLLAVTSLMYLLQDHSLTHKYFGGFFNLLPSLRQLNEISQRLLAIGIISLTIAMLIGTLSWLPGSGTVNLFKLISVWGLLLCYFSLYLIKKCKSLSLRKSTWMSLLLFLMTILSLWPVQYT